MSTYSQIYIQIVFAVKNRQALIANSWQEELYKAMNEPQKPKQYKKKSFRDDIE